jgi:hypothetical protein
LLALLAPAAAGAQQVSGDLQGRVLNVAGQPLADAQVTLAGPTLQGERSTLSDTRGRFVLPAVPPGIYLLAIRLIGFRPVRFEDLPVRLGETTSLGDIRLESQAVELPDIVVSGSKPVIDPVSPAAGAALDSSQFLTLPSDRSFRSLITFVPQANASFYPGDGVNIGGSTGLENAFYVDGVDVSVFAASTIDLPFNFVREIEVKTGGYEAEFGRALSGVVNVVTPSGGNQFHGQVLGFYTGNQLRAPPKVGIYETDVTKFSRYDLGISLSGPLRRDRLWYSIAYNPSFARRLESIGVVPKRRDVDVHNVFAGKLSWSARPGTDLTLTLLGDPSHRDGVEPVLPLTTDPATALSRYSRGSTMVALSARQELGRGAQLQFGMSRLTAHDDFYPRSGATDNLAALTQLNDPRDDGTLATTGGLGWYDLRHETHTAVRVAVMLWRGTHTLKGGAEYESNRTHETVHGSFVTRQGDSSYDWWEPFLVSRVGNRIPTVYVQDAWEVTPRLQITGGLRWESQHISGAGPDRTVPIELAPRLGVVFQLGAPGSARLLGSAGRYYEQVPALSAIWWNGRGFYQDRHFPANPLIDSSNADTLQRLVVPVRPSRDLLGQSYDQFSLGFERRLGAAYKVGVRGTYRVLRWIIEDGFAPGDTVDRMGNPGRGTLAAMPRARQHYVALELSAERATPGRLYLLTSCVLSRNVGNYTGLYATDNLVPLPNSGSTYDVPDAMTNAYGLLPNDRTVVFKTAVSYRPRDDVTLGGFLAVATGTPLSEGGTSAYGSGYWTFVRQRGSAGRTPTIWSLDLHGAYDLPVARGGRIHPRLLVDLFNVGNPRKPVLFDQRHYYSADRTAVNPLYRAVTSYQPPMSARAGMTVDF